MKRRILLGVFMLVFALCMSGCGSSKSDLPCPTNLKAVAGDGKVILTWDKYPGATLYVALMSYNPDSFTGPACQTTTNTYIFNELPNGKTCYFKVSANVEGTRYTDVISATPFDDNVIVTNVK